MNKFLTTVAMTFSIIAPVCHADAASDKQTLDDGRAVYKKWCGECHDDGPAYPGTRALTVKYKGSAPAALLQRTDLSPDFIKYYVRNGFSAMPIFRKTEINDAQLRALTVYLTTHADKGAPATNGDNTKPKGASS